MLPNLRLPDLLIPQLASINPGKAAKHISDQQVASAGAICKRLADQVGDFQQQCKCFSNILVVTFMVKIDFHYLSMVPGEKEFETCESYLRGAQHHALPRCTPAAATIVCLQAVWGNEAEAGWPLEFGGMINATE